jgi:hypothetical protein
MLRLLTLAIVTVLAVVVLALLRRRRSQASSAAHSGPASCLVWDRRNVCTESGTGR